MTVGQKIKEERLRAGMTQKELAEKSGVPAITIQQYEREVRHPRSEKLNMLAAAFDIPVSALLDMPEEGIEDRVVDRLLSNGTVAKSVGDYLLGAATTESIDYMAPGVRAGRIAATLLHNIEKDGASPASLLTEYEKIVDLKVAESILILLTELSQDGQLIALGRINELTKIPEYQKKE